MVANGNYDFFFTVCLVLGCHTQPHPSKQKGNKENPYITSFNTHTHITDKWKFFYSVRLSVCIISVSNILLFLYTYNLNLWFFQVIQFSDEHDISGIDRHSNTQYILIQRKIQILF